MKEAHLEPSILQLRCPSQILYPDISGRLTNCGELGDVYYLLSTKPWALLNPLMPGVPHHVSEFA
jgi:hypothetical protein